MAVMAAFSTFGTAPLYLAIGNEAGFNLIFRNYAAKITTAGGEKLGQNGLTISEREKEIKTMKMSLERVATEAMTRKLKAEYSMELAQDLKNVHGLDAEQESACLVLIHEDQIKAKTSFKYICNGLFHRFWVRFAILTAILCTPL